MRPYRFYIIGASGHAQGTPTLFEAATDADAIRQANKIVCANQDIEIWLETRLVAYVTYATARAA